MVYKQPILNKHRHHQLQMLDKSMFTLAFTYLIVCGCMYLCCCSEQFERTSKNVITHTHTKKCVENYVLFTHNSLDVLLLQLVAFDHIDYNNV